MLILGDQHLFNCAVARNEWKELAGGDLTSFTWTGLTLRNGARYTMRVGAVNHAGFLASFETNGVIIDVIPPIVSINFLNYLQYTLSVF